MNEGRILLATGSILIIVGCQQPTTTKKTIAIEARALHHELGERNRVHEGGQLELAQTRP